MQAPPPSLPPIVHHDEASSSAALRAVKDITFGSIAGMVSKVFEHPFDLTKVRLQSQVLDATARFKGPIDCLVQTWSKEGVRGLYRGLPAPIVGAMAENASMFVSYNQIQNAVRWYSGQSPADELTLGQLSVAAAGAGAITSFFLTPIELVKCKMQVQMLLTPPASLEVLVPTNTGTATLGAPSSSPSGSKAHNLPGPIAVLKSVVQTSGLRGLWLGQTGTLIRETGGGAAWFVSKEAVARLLISRRPSSSSSASTSSSDGGPSQKQHLAVWESAVSGGFAGLAYNVALFPADTVKSAVQTEAEMRPRAPGEPYPSFVATARAMYKAQGLRGLYAGCGITAARAVPSSALIFVIYDGLTKRFG